MRREERKQARLHQALVSAFEAKEVAWRLYVEYSERRAAPVIEIMSEEERELRAAHPRIKRSRRTGRGLRAWAKSVLGEDAYGRIHARYRERIRFLALEAKERLQEADARFAALAAVTPPAPGPEREWRLHPWTHEGRFGAERAGARDQARLDVAVARAAGIHARYEEVHGRYEGRSHWVPQGHLVGAGFWVFAGVAHEADLALLRMRAAAAAKEWYDRLSEVTLLAAEGREGAFRDYVRDKEAFLATGD